MPTDKILTWADYADQKRGHPGSIIDNRLESYPHWLARVWEYYHEGEFTPADLPVKPPNPPYLNAYVNHGRWLTACDCGGTIAPVEPGQDYLCAVCEEWHRVMWPEYKTMIDARLLALPGFRLNNVTERNWRPN